MITSTPPGEAGAAHRLGDELVFEVMALSTISDSRRSRHSPDREGLS